MVDEGCYELNVLKRYNKEYSDIVSIKEDICKGTITILFKDDSRIYFNPKLKSNERSISAIVESFYQQPSKSIDGNMDKP